MCCLDDTRLQPPYPPFAGRPVNLVPAWSVSRGGTRGLTRVHLRFPHAVVRQTFSSVMTRWKSARFGGGPGRSLSTRLQGGLGFFQHPLPAALSAPLAVRLPRQEESNGFTVFRDEDTDGLAPARTPAASLSVGSRLTRYLRLRCHFGSSPGASVGLLALTMRNAVTFTLGLPSCPCPGGVTLAAPGVPSRLHPSRCRLGMLSRQLSDQAVTSLAGAVRRLRTEPQVRPMLPYRTIFITTSRRTETFA